MAHRAPGTGLAGTGLAHNRARSVFAEALLAQLVTQGVDLLTGGILADPDDLDLPYGAELDDYAAEPAESGGVHRARPGRRPVPGSWPAIRTSGPRSTELWPLRTPERLLAELLGSPEWLAEISTDADLTVLHRPDGAAWTVADAPLLDELAELLGPLPRPDRAEPGHRPGYAAAVLQRARPSTTAAYAATGGSGRAAGHRLRQRGGAGRPVRAGADRERRRAGRGGPRVDLRAPGGRRGAGAVGHGLARAGPALPHPVDHRGRGPGPAQFPGRRAGVGRRARPGGRRPVDPGAV